MTMNQPAMPPPPAGAGSKEERTWAMLAHLSAFTMFIFPLGNILAPLIIWKMKGDEFPLVNDQAKESLNFQISVTLYALVATVLVFLLIGIPILIALGVFVIVIVIIAALKANEGVAYRYPLCLRFIS